MITRSDIEKIVFNSFLGLSNDQIIHWPDLDSLSMLELITEVERILEENDVIVSIKYGKYTEEEFIDYIWHSIPRKLIITDLDFTMWDGLLTERGQDVEVNVEYQQWLADQAAKGILLAISSNNTEEVVHSLFADIGNLLQWDDFSYISINWGRKDGHVQEILKSLNLLPSSAVFIDDAVHNREIVSHVFPEILCIHPNDYHKLHCFEYKLTEEDYMRAEFYKEEIQRRALMSQEDWQRQLKLEIEIHNYLGSQDEHEPSERLIQLFAKVNQMNLSTRRLSLEELDDYATSNDKAAYWVRATDKFGSYGIIGVMTTRKDGEKVMVDDFVVSCRALGRGIEETMIYHILNQNMGFTVEFPIKSTEYNEPAQHLFCNLDRLMNLWHEEYSYE